MLTKLLILCFINLWVATQPVVKNKKPAQKRHHIYNPDTTINNTLILENRCSIEKNLGDVMPFVKDSDDGPFVYFQNLNGSEYLKM